MQSEHKSAEEIDDETRRVVIISANKEDRNESILGSNHKLILNIPDNHHLETETLDNLQLFLTKLAAAREIDNLHEMMHELAIDMDLPLLNDEIWNAMADIIFPSTLTLLFTFLHWLRSSPPDLCFQADSRFWRSSWRDSAHLAAETHCTEHYR